MEVLVELECYRAERRILAIFGCVDELSLTFVSKRDNPARQEWLQFEVR